MQVERSVGSIHLTNPAHIRAASRVAALALAAGLAACGDSSGPQTGPLASFTVTPTTGLSALAGTTITTPIIVTPKDASGRTVPNQHATFTVTGGGGSVANTTGQTNPDGTITGPAWTLGKSAVPQTLQVIIGARTVSVSATIQTSYPIEIRFFGRTLTAGQQALFTNAAARLRGAIIGPIPSVDLTGADPSVCGATGQPVMSGSTTGVVIFASIDSIDGPNKILAQSGPCYIRDGSNGSSDFRTAVGVMQFDSADIGSLQTSGNLQEVVTHEMMHVLGFGTFWDSNSENLLVNPSTANVAYTGAGGIAGCRSIGGTVTCANSVPVEGTQGGDGTINGHWRESTFGNELMTGFLNTGTNPFSAMSIEAMEDLGYPVNLAAADPYHIPGGSLRAAGDVITGATVQGTPKTWERPIGVRPRALPTMNFPLGPVSK